MYSQSPTPDTNAASLPADMFAATHPGCVVRFSNRPGIRWLVGGIGVLAALIAINAAVFGSKLPFEQGRTAKAAAVRHTNDVIAAARQVSYEVRDAESGRRSYRLSGSPDDLAAYRAEMHDARRAAADLTELTRDEPVQQDKISLLDKLLAIDVTPAADHAGAGGSSLPLPFNAVRETIASVVEQEVQLLQTRMAAVEEAERRGVMIVTILSIAPLLIVVLCAAALAVILIASKNINRAAAERERLLNIMDLAAVIVREMDGTIRFWSEACERLFGWTSAEAVGQVSHRLLRTEFPESRAEVEETLLRTGGWFGELRHQSRDGADVIVLARKILRRAAGGRSLVLEMLTDTTALQRSEAALRKSQAILHSVVGTAAECIIVSDSDGKIISINQAGVLMFGYDREAELLGQDVNMLMPQAERARHAADVAAYRDGAPPRIIGVPSRELEAMRRNGSIFPIDLSISAFGTNGNRFLTGIIRDTTVRKAAEKALRDSEARLRLVQQVGEIANADWATSGARAFVSEEYHRLYGLAPDQAPGTFEQWLERVHPDDRGRIAAEARVLNEQPYAVALQFRIRRPDRALRWIAMRAESFREPDGSLRIISGHQDITDIVAAREALAQRRDELEQQIAERTTALVEAEEQFRAVFDSQFQFVAVLALDGTVLLANRTALESGYCDAADVIGRPFWETKWWPEVDADRLRRKIGEAASGTLVRREMAVRDLAGRSVWIDISFKPVLDSANGQVRQIVAEWRDVTELRELAEKLAQAQKVQALGQLAGGIAHDFNNILQSVSGAAMLIERRPEDLDRTRRLARSAIDAASRGASITQRLLSFARRGTLRAEVIATHELLNSMREVLAHTLGTGISVRVSVPDAGVPPLLADRGQLETALVNLGTNARDAMPDGGTLTLSAEAADAPGDGLPPANLAAGHYVRITVADTGCGMNAATFARVAEPFFTTKPIGSGTGLGLAMVKGFAEQSGGAMTVTSDLGIGTTVEIWLARALDDAVLNRADETADRPISSGVLRIMMVDDDDLVRETLAEQMEELGFETIVASSGSEALALLESGVTVDALVSDLSMPGMSGVATIQRVHVLRPGLPCFLLTGYVGERAALEAGAMFTLVHKPISGKKLAARIEAAVGANVC